MLARFVGEFPSFFTFYNCLFLLKAMAATFLLSTFGCAIGLAIGFLVAVVRRLRGSVFVPAHGLAILFVEFFRRVPFLVTLMLVFFAFNLARVEISVFSVALVSVCLISTAYIAEIVRAGFESVHRNQWDAAAVMNFGLFQTLALVVVPQAWPVILPPAFSFFVLFIKDTALASQIGVVELTYAGKVFNNEGFSAALAFGSVLVLYFALSYPLTRVGRWTEARLAGARRR